MVRAVVEGVEAVDPDPPALLGGGTTAQPYKITDLPFALGVEFESHEDGPNDYSACGAHAGATGPAMVFSLEVDEPTPIRVLAVPTTGECVAAKQFNDCNDSTDIVVAVYEDEIVAANCLYAHSTVVDGPLTPGHTYYVVVVDSYGEAALALLSVHRCHPDDPSCT